MNTTDNLPQQERTLLNTHLPAQLAAILRVPERRLPNRSRLALFVSAAYLVASLSACATKHDLPSRKSIAGMGYPTITGLGQVLDPNNGELTFVPCNPCAAPTVKTPVIIVPPKRMGEPNPIFTGGNPATMTQPLTMPVQAATTDVRPTPEPAYVLFSSGSAKLSAAALAYISQLITKKDISVEVTGQTDSTGNASANERLAFARARSVATALIAAGVSKSAIEITTCLKCFPADNSTDEGKKQNRRAVITFSKGS